jgi:hypothetical protein
MAGWTSSVAVATAVWPCVSATVKDTVVDPTCWSAVVRVAVQLNVSAPHPGLIEMPAVGNRAALLLLALTVSVPVPESVNAIGDGEFGKVTD